MNATPPLTPPATRPLASPWWLAPALCTVVAILGGAWGYRSSPLFHATAWVALPYAIPLALVAASWWSSYRRNTRVLGLVLGGIGAFASLICAQLATFLLYTVAFLLWAFQGGG
ncbi:hypothetical protein OG625_01220 [Streptomyces sp. NBC_01351]|uniref:hypothetical protein n=1 Tax=Streptomyces sp. NBC_01351 TaxID=2903833 RepID=UPI002E32ADBF|nr:hypothetical protein [Streptomyces sp. NBC_01351]